MSINYTFFWGFGGTIFKSLSVLSVPNFSWYFSGQIGRSLEILLVLPGAAPPEFGDAQHHVLRLPRAYVGASAATQSLHERLLSGAAGPQFCGKSPSVVVLEMDFALSN